jgi:hypothetical protein
LSATFSRADASRLAGRNDARRANDACTPDNPIAEKDMNRIPLIAIAMLGAAAAVHAADNVQDTARKDPKTGKNCVTLLSSESTPTGRTLVNFRNTCDSPFRVEIDVPERTRTGTIEAGTPEKPAKASVSCRADDRCEAAKWSFN